MMTTSDSHYHAHTLSDAEYRQRELANLTWRQRYSDALSALTSWLYFDDWARRHHYAAAPRATVDKVQAKLRYVDGLIGWSEPEEPDDSHARREREMTDD